MKLIRIMGPCLLAVFAMNALAPSAVSAQFPDEPYEFRNEKSELVVKKGFIGGGTTTSFWTGFAGSKVLECYEHDISGKILGSQNVVGVVITFRHCDFHAGLKKCPAHSTYPSIGGAGEIKTVELMGVLGELPGRAIFDVDTGLDLEPETLAKTWFEFDAGECGGNAVGGQLIGVIKPENELTEDPFLKYERGSSGLQRERQIESGGSGGELDKEDRLKDKEGLELVYTGEDVTVFEEKLEVHAP